ncbi:S-adenosyl-L-methionine-dependent methyltransferase [Lojkania enalia]|uniref:S-adenosyl-L-methionine-dependent methyltransferase n=1 Tax=Lojkania enalia TaxID=147567 RepID=A0A9P4K1D1_9PLEO|nr:S-adenosyl-L-methionine-dependent methyltransferase [Didymosphaeria enalia]
MVTADNTTAPHPVADSKPPKPGFDGFVPADDAEAERLWMQHIVLIDALDNRIVCPPLDLTVPGLKILESGTADGHWLRHLRSCIPNPERNTYIGTDLNPRLFPTSVPKDCQFCIHNISEPWPEKEHRMFDLVHQRLTLPGGAPTPLQQIVRQLFDLVKPGGWIQLVEAEQIGLESGPVFDEFLDLVRAVFDKTGAGWHYAERMKGWLEEAGAVDLDEVTVKMAFGKKNQKEELNEGSARITAQAMKGLVMHAKMMKDLKTNLNVEQLDTLEERLLKELTELGAYYPIRIVWGRKKRENEG